MALTPYQAAAVKYDKHLILFAGPGSGKTSTSVEKGALILSEPSHALCMVTFTSAAAEEMRERMKVRFVSQGLPPPGNRLLCGTFHSLALRHYQKHTRQAKRLIAPPARTGMVNAMLANVEPNDRKDYLLSLERYQGALNQGRIEFEKEEHYTFVNEYYKRLNSTNSTDLAMLMRECATLMSSGDMPIFPVTHMLGDEIQDADEIQLEMILAHTRRGVITTLVGDDDQCIYEWRSALGYAGMLHFAKESGAKTIALAENFRSREEIVAHANQLIAYNDPDRIEKNQRATRGPGGVLGHLGFASTKHQCRYVAEYIEKFQSPGESVAVLARTNLPLIEMGRALHSRAIPYVKDGESLWDIPAVAVFVSTLTGLTNCSTGSLHPAFSLLPITDKTRREFERNLGTDATSIFHGVLPELTHATAGELKVLQDTSTALRVWRSNLDAGEVNIVIPQVADVVYNWYHAHLNASKTSPTTVKSQLKKIRSSFEAAEDILLKLKGKLSVRLSTLTRLQDKDQNAGAVQLMTMHGYKGLEFDTVFLLDAFAPDDGKTVIDEAPERRLFFVAITRAKERFFALYSDTPSPFIAEAALPPLEAATAVAPS